MADDGAQLQHDREARLRVSQVDPSHLDQPTQSVPKSVGVYVKSRCRSTHVAEFVEIGAQRLDQVGVVLRVVGDQPGDRTGRLIAPRDDDVA